jgi:hypothetical protein
MFMTAPAGQVASAWGSRLVLLAQLLLLEACA